MFKNFCRCNAAVSDLYDGKSKNKIAVVFFFPIPMAVSETTYYEQNVYGNINNFAAFIKIISVDSIT